MSPRRLRPLHRPRPPLASARTVRSSAQSPAPIRARRLLARVPLVLGLLALPLVPGATPAPAAGAPLAPATAQEAEWDDGLAQSRPLRVFLITIDQGDEVWEKFGHNAILIRNEATGEELAWNWGLFDFDDVDFIPRFLRGTMEYSMGGMEAQWMIEHYASANRSVYANEIGLSLEQAAALDSFVRWNAQPENRNYIYDYFRDNCSTRVRDALDRVLGGALQAHFQDRITPQSFRWHARRLVQGTLWIDQGLSFLLGTRGDRPITEWEAMYVPMVLMELLEDFDLPLADGTTRPLLGPRQVLFEADRAPTPDEAPAFSPLFGLLGLLGAGLLMVLGRWGSTRPVHRTAGPTSDHSSDLTGDNSRDPTGDNSADSDDRHGRARWSRIVLGVVGLGWTLLAGVLGTILVLVWFTDHVFIHRNVNLLYLNPLALVVGGLLIGSLLSARRAHGWVGRWGALLAVVIALGSLVAALLQVSGLIVQGNAEVIAVALPMNLGLALAMMRLHRG